jgi:hypothetical protein
MRCAKCSAGLPDGAPACPTCGAVRFEFRGAPLEALGWIALTIVGTALVAPLAWVSAGVARWLCRRTGLSDGTTLGFRGAGADVVVWHVFYVATLVGQSFALYAVAGEGIAATAVVLLISYVVLIAIVHTLIRWFVFNAQLSSGPPLSFEGSFLALFGWYLALAAAIYTLVGWAWVAAAMYRWMARQVRGRGVAFEFHGQGHEMLWRAAAALLACAFLVPIPWVAVWFLKWLIGGVTLTRKREDELTVPA